MKFKFTDWSFLQRETEAIESHLKKEHDQFMQTTVIFEAKNYASKNMPTDNEESFEPYLTTIRGFYGKLKKEVSIKLQGGTQRTIGAANVTTSNQNIENKERIIKKETEAHDRLVVDRGRIFIEGDHASYKKQRVLLIIFATGECLWTVSAFLKLGDIMLIALCLGIVIGIAQISVVKSAVQIIKEIEDKKKRKLYTIIAVASAFALSFCLALLRYWFIHKGTGTNVPFIVMNPLTFVAINMLFIAATALIVLFNYPSKTQLSDMHKAEDIDKEIKASNERIKVLDDELVTLKKEREFLVELRVRMIHAETKLHEKVNVLFDLAVGVFKHENTIKRADNVFPRSFKNPHRPLSDETDENPTLIED